MCWFVNEYFDLPEALMTDALNPHATCSYEMEHPKAKTTVDNKLKLQCQALCGFVQQRGRDITMI
jgi:hypothetical protein